MEEMEGVSTRREEVRLGWAWVLRMAFRERTKRNQTRGEEKNKGQLEEEEEEIEFETTAGETDLTEEQSWAPRLRDAANDYE